MLLFFLLVRDQYGFPSRWSHHGNDDTIDLYAGAHLGHDAGGDVSYHHIRDRLSYHDLTVYRGHTSFIGNCQSNVSRT